MSNYKRMNMIAIPVAIVLLFLMFYVGAAYRLFNDSLWRGVGCIGVSAFAGYMLGCLIGLLVNLILRVSRKIRSSGLYCWFLSDGFRCYLFGRFIKRFSTCTLNKGWSRRSSS